MTKLVHITTVPESLAFLRGQAEFMRTHGIEMTAVSSPGKALVEFGESEGVPVRAVSMTRRISPLRDLVSLVQLIWLLQTLKPDVVHAHTPKAGLLGMIGAWVSGVPVRIYHMRGLPLTTAIGLRRWLLGWTETMACRMAQRVFAVGHSLRELAIECRLCRAEKICVLHHGSGQGVDAKLRFNPNRVSPRERQAARERFGIPSDALVVGFVGRLVKDKGIRELASAWANVRNQHPMTHLLVVGPEEQRDALPERVLERLRSDPRVHLAGADWNTPPLYAAMDLVVLPTYREGFPNVPLEGAAMQLPVVTTNVPGAKDAVVDGVTGTIIPAKDVDKLEDAVGRYLRDPFLRQRHGIAGRQRVLQDFSPEIIHQGILATYAELLSLTGRPLPLNDKTLPPRRLVA